MQKNVSVVCTVWLTPLELNPVAQGCIRLAAHSTIFGSILGPICPLPNDWGGMAPSVAWSQTIICPNTPQVFDVNMIILMLLIESEPP